MDSETRKKAALDAGKLEWAELPAKQRNATGYHCPANLQIISASENLSKGCYFDDWT